MAIIVLIVILILTYFSLSFLKNRWTLYQLNIPDPKTFPFVIEIFYPLFKLGTASAEDRFKVIAEYCFKFPDLLKLWLGPKMIIFVNDPDRMLKVLMSPQCLEKNNLFYGLMERDHGLISGSLKRKWKEHRKFFNFSFNLKILESFMPTFVECSEHLCSNLELEVGKADFDFFKHAKKVSFDMLCATSLGTNIKEYRSQPIYEKVFGAYETTELAMNQKFSIPFLYPQTIYKMTKLFRRERKAQKLLNEFQKDLLTKRRLLIAQTKVSNCIRSEEIGRNILIDHIILNEEKFTSDEIRDHILTFVSGYETWANALAHAMLLLAMHPEVQEKLYDEIKACISTDDDLRSAKAINSLKYLDMVQRETFRLLPTVPMVLRETLEAFELEHGLVIPKETSLVLNFYVLHRRKDIWGADADRFIPERFAPENASNRHKFAFLPFSSGSRICIGYKYSNISLKIAIIKLLQSFKFSTKMQINEIRLKSYISLKLCTSHLMSVENRQ